MDNVVIIRLQPLLVSVEKEIKEERNYDLGRELLQRQLFLDCEEVSCVKENRIEWV